MYRLAQTNSFDRCFHCDECFISQREMDIKIAGSFGIADGITDLWGTSEKLP